MILNAAYLLVHLQQQAPAASSPDQQQTPDFDLLGSCQAATKDLLVKSIAKEGFQFLPRLRLQPPLC